MSWYNETPWLEAWLSKKCLSGKWPVIQHKNCSRYNLPCYQVKISAITGHNRSVTTGKEQTISCLIDNLDSAADVQWMDVTGNKLISPGDTNNYEIDDGISSFSGGSQTTKLTLMLPVVVNIRSARTYRCSISSTHFPGSGHFGIDIAVTPIGKLVMI